MQGVLAASVFDGFLRGHVAEDPVEEAALVARADEDLARAAELESLFIVHFCSQFLDVVGSTFC